MASLIDAFNRFNLLPEKTARKSSLKIRSIKNWLKQELAEAERDANLMVAQFFIPKTVENKDCLVTNANYLEYLYGTKEIPWQSSTKTFIVDEKGIFFIGFLSFLNLY